MACSSGFIGDVGVGCLYSAGPSIHWSTYCVHCDDEVRYIWLTLNHNTRARVMKEMACFCRRLLGKLHILRLFAQNKPIGPVCLLGLKTDFIALVWWTLLTNVGFLC